MKLCFKQLVISRSNHAAGGMPVAAAFRSNEALLWLSEMPKKYRLATRQHFSRTCMSLSPQSTGPWWLALCPIVATNLVLRFSVCITLNPHKPQQCAKSTNPVSACLASQLVAGSWWCALRPVKAAVMVAGFSVWATLNPHRPRPPAKKSPTSPPIYTILAPVRACLPSQLVAGP